MDDRSVRELDEADHGDQVEVQFIQSHNATVRTLRGEFGGIVKDSLSGACYLVLIERAKIRTAYIQTFRIHEPSSGRR